MALLSYRVAYSRYETENISNEIKILPRLVKEVLDRRDDFLKIAKEIKDNEHVFFIGRKGW